MSLLLNSQLDMSDPVINGSSMNTQLFSNHARRQPLFTKGNRFSFKRRVYSHTVLFVVEAKGVEPLSTACKAVVLPLNEAPGRRTVLLFTKKNNKMVEEMGLEPTVYDMPCRRFAN